jgi:hypothetical protein
MSSPITHIANKTMADRTREPASAVFQRIHQTLEQADQAMDNAPPPPYSDADSDDSEDDDFLDGLRHQQEQPQHKLTINAEHKITGQCNLVSLNPSVLADATRFSAILLNAIAQLNSAAAAAANADGEGQTRKPLCVDLTINCGVHVVGSRNVVGVGLKRKAPVPTPEGSAAAEMVDIGATTEGAVGGAKRKADGDDDVSFAPFFSPVPYW